MKRYSRAKFKIFVHFEKSSCLQTAKRFFIVVSGKIVLATQYNRAKGKDWNELKSLAGNLFTVK